MMRLADGFNIQSVIISGYTADITNPQVKRASLGAEKNIQILADDENKFELKKLIQQNYTIIALETAMPNEAIEQTKFTNNTVIIVGNEKNGVPESLLNLCNKIVKIPMHGIKNSLNVVSALSITCYEWNKQCR